MCVAGCGLGGEVALCVVGGKKLWAGDLHSKGEPPVAPRARGLQQRTARRAPDTAGAVLSLREPAPGLCCPLCAPDLQHDAYL